MKRILFSLTALAITMSSNAYAQDTLRGTMVIKTVTNGCQDIIVGSEFNVRYAPKTTENGNDSKLALFAQFSGSDWAQSLTLAGREFDGTLRPVDVVSIWAGARSLASTSTNPPAVKVAFSSVKRTPGANNTTAATEFMQVSGSITNFYPLYYTNCNVTFRMSLVKATPM